MAFLVENQAKLSLIKLCPSKEVSFLIVSMEAAKTLPQSGLHLKKRRLKLNKFLVKLSKVWAPGPTLKCNSLKTQMSPMSSYHPVLLRLSQSSKTKRTLTMDKGHLKAKTPQIKSQSSKAHPLDSNGAL